MFPFWGFEIFVSHLFLLHVLAFGSVEYQRIAFRKQILKKKIMTLFVACLFYYLSIPGSTTVFMLSKKMNLINTTANLYTCIYCGGSGKSPFDGNNCNSCYGTGLSYMSIPEQINSNPVKSRGNLFGACGGKTTCPVCRGSSLYPKNQTIFHLTHVK